MGQRLPCIVSGQRTTETHRPSWAKAATPPLGLKAVPLRSVRLSYGLPVLKPSSHMPVPAASPHHHSATLSSHWRATPLSLQVLGFQERLKSDSVSLVFSANHRSLEKPFSKLDAHPWSSEQWSEGHVAQMQPCTLGEGRGWTGMATGCI